VIKQQFGFTKVRYRGLAKNTTQIVTLFALSNLWMARRRLIGLIDILLEKRRDKTAAKRFCMCSSRPAPA